MTTITRDTTIVRSDDFLASTVDNELVMISLEQGNYYALDDIGSRVWELLAAPITVADLCAQLQPQFAVTPEQCEADVLGFLADLQEEGMVQVIDAGIAETP
ncbi:MAG: lasso peptide biosynthesis PqqD family chaperone [Chloroflexi bacterium]|nr:lasso peptide biosynthesis PqqD family chaperone [Chloroflexota bacterium]